MSDIIQADALDQLLACPDPPPVPILRGRLILDLLPGDRPRLVLLVRCPHCGTDHAHLWVPGDGRRIVRPRCWAPFSPYRATGHAVEPTDSEANRRVVQRFTEQMKVLPKDGSTTCTTHDTSDS